MPTQLEESCRSPCLASIRSVRSSTSFVSDPYGNVLARGSHDAVEIVLTECDFGLIDVARTHWPFLRDRRVDAYEDLVKRWRD
jgi:N-carbamoylputrescine amidase